MEWSKGSKYIRCLNSSRDYWSRTRTTILWKKSFQETVVPHMSGCHIKIILIFVVVITPNLLLFSASETSNPYPVYF